MIPPLVIIQARLHSARLEKKMLCHLAGETLIARAWRLACATFGADQCVVAIPIGDIAGPLGDELRRIGARIFAYGGRENDVLGRFWACAHTYRWRPESVVFRWTPDDVFKDAEMCKRVADGERLPVEQGGEAFTLATLDEVFARDMPEVEREHLTPLLFPVRPPAPPAGCWSVDTAADLAAAELILHPPKRGPGRPRKVTQ